MGRDKLLGAAELLVPRNPREILFTMKGLRETTERGLLAVNTDEVKVRAWRIIATIFISLGCCLVVMAWPCHYRLQ